MPSFYKGFDLDPEINSRDEFAAWLADLKAFVESDNAKLVHRDVWGEASIRVSGIARAFGLKAMAIEPPTYELKPDGAQEMVRCELLEQVNAILDILSGKKADDYMARTPAEWAKRFGVTQNTSSRWQHAAKNK